MSSIAIKAISKQASSKRQFQRSLGDYWHYYIEKGQQFHHRGMINEAAHYFFEAVRVSEGLIFDDIHRVNQHSHNALEMYYTANHNLASCYNLMNKASKGEKTLRQCYEQISSLACGAQYPKALRLESLCILERVLFSYTSQLASMNKPAEIHTIIQSTDILVTQLQAQLEIA